MGSGNTLIASRHWFCRSVSCTPSERSQGNLMQERPTHLSPILCNGIHPFVDTVIEASSSRPPSVRKRKPEDAPHRLRRLSERVQHLTLESRIQVSGFWLERKHPQKNIKMAYLVAGTDTVITVDQIAIRGSSNARWHKKPRTSRK